MTDDKTADDKRIILKDNNSIVVDGKNTSFGFINPKDWVSFIIKQLEELLEQIEQLKRSESPVMLHYYYEAKNDIEGLIWAFKEDIQLRAVQSHIHSYFTSFININYQIRQHLESFVREEIMFAVNTSSKIVIIERMYNFLVFDALAFNYRRMQTIHGVDDLNMSDQKVEREFHKKLGIRDK